MSSLIYLDNAATTKVYDEAISAMNSVYSCDYFNPSSTYKNGISVKKLINDSRAVIAKRLGCLPSEIYFTSCATEANNWALTSGFKNKKGNIVVSSGEHACVYECAKALKNSGLDVRFAKLTPSGIVDIEHLSSLVDENTNLVSVIHASNETGAINDLGRISYEIKRKNPKVLLHSDGVQAYLKTDNDLKRLGVDLYSVSGHKVGAPKGVGLLFVSSKVKLRPFIYGGGQENGLRSGTENVAGIVSLSVATEKFAQQRVEFDTKKLREYICEELLKIPSVSILSRDVPTTDFIVTFVADGIKAEIIQTTCCDDGVIIGRGSACSSRHSGNRVLSEMGLSQRQIDGALRISISPTTTKDDIKHAIIVIANNIEKLRERKIG